MSSERPEHEVFPSQSFDSLLRLWFPLTVGAASLTFGITLATVTGIRAPLPVLQGLVATVAIIIQVEAIIKYPDDYGVQR